MEIMSHLIGALGRLVLWVSSMLVIEELTLGGLARLLLSRLSRPSTRPHPARGRPRG